MSFSSNVKAELCRPPISRRTEALAEAYGVLLYCNTFTGSAVRVVTESRDFAERLPRLFKKAFGVGFDETPNPDEPGKLLLAIEQKDKLERLLTALDMRADGEVALHVNFGLLEEEPEQLAFFRGAFLAGGSVTDPAKRYHLELATPHLKVSAEASVLLREIGFSAKETSRAGNSILYFKQSDTIEDFLTRRRTSARPLTLRLSSWRRSDGSKRRACSRRCRRNYRRRRGSAGRTRRRRSRSWPKCRIRRSPNPRSTTGCGN